VRSPLLLVIRLYWAVWPKRLRRGCLFRESCSHHVHRVTRTGGLASGLRALRERYRRCRPGYAMLNAHGTLWLSLADGSFIPASEISPVILRTCVPTPDGAEHSV
jgi:putative component of membrane protein insertase Oxa1/YidC/SpoIIIJ protein YidD